MYEFPGKELPILPTFSRCARITRSADWTWPPPCDVVPQIPTITRTWVVKRIDLYSAARYPVLAWRHFRHSSISFIKILMTQSSWILKINMINKCRTHRPESTIFWRFFVTILKPMCVSKEMSCFLFMKTLKFRWDFDQTMLNCGLLIARSVTYGVRNSAPMDAQDARTDMSIFLVGE